MTPRSFSAFLTIILSASAAFQCVNGQPNAAPPASAPISWNSVGTAATRVSPPAALGVSATNDGAWLHCPLQRIDGHATSEGLWISSTTTNSHGERFRLSAAALGRIAARTGTVAADPLPSSGQIRFSKSLVTWERAGLTEEYSLSADGLRQDFVILRRPPGDGKLRLELSLSGARAEAAPYGAKLVLNGSGRELAYSRLHVCDAAGRELVGAIEVLTEHRLSVRVDDSTAAYPLRIDPTFSDANWISLGGVEGLANGLFNAIVIDTNIGTLYAGGLFSGAIGTTLATNIAEWNGTSWSALGPGLGATVQALAVDPAGNLYAGGLFTNAGTTAVNFVAEWNGSAWVPLGQGMNGRIVGLRTDSSGNLYAGGLFTTADGSPANNVAVWNGFYWSPLGAGMNAGVGSLVFDSFGNLYAGGSFTTADGGSAPYMAVWNGSYWSSVGSGFNNFVNALAFDSLGNLYAGGGFTMADGLPATNIAMWNGSGWSALGSGMNATVVSLAVDAANNLYVGGSFTRAGGVSATNFAKWNGTAWSAAGPALNAAPRVLTPDAFGGIYAGGNFITAGTNTVMHIGRWNGASWSNLGSGNGGSVSPFGWVVVADGGGNLYAGGGFLLAGGVNVNGVAKWNGSAWSALGSGMGAPNNAPTVYALALDGAGNLYAAGAFTNAGGVMASNIAKWNGSAWSALGAGVGGSSSTEVNALAWDGAGNLYASGHFTVAGAVPANNVAKWNGSTWSALGSGMNSTVFGLCWDGAGHLYAGGIFTNAGGVTANGIAKWDGTNWSALGSGVGPTVEVNGMIADRAGNLYVAGDFTTAGGVPANYIAVWNGSTWSPLGSGFNNDSYGLAFDSLGNLYVGGGFSLAGGVPAANIARWDGNTWSALGSGLNFPVVSLATDSAGRLYVAGPFTVAGTNVSGYIVQANLGPYISGTRRNADGSVTFNLLTTPNTTNRVLAATNLTAQTGWQPIYTNVAPASGALQITDSNANHFPARFYQSSTP